MKNKYKIYDWYLVEKFRPMSMCIEGPEKYFKLVGISDQREDGRRVETSKILNINFVTGVAETKNSIYYLMNKTWRNR